MFQIDDSLVPNLLSTEAFASPHVLSILEEAASRAIR
jgi:hypothetical protein